MTKRKDDARRRLQQAGLELFAERGYDRVTAAEIAARARVTERTFFRHFPDKREVLFDGEKIVRAALEESIGRAPANLGPMATLFRAFRAAGSMFEEYRQYSKPRQEVINSTPALRERELAKHAALADHLATLLAARGVDPERAILAARTGMMALVYATHAWLDDPSRTFEQRIDFVEAELRHLVS